MDSFRKQFETVNSESMKTVEVQTPYGKWSYEANPIATIVCVDKHNQLATLRNGPTVEMKLTYGARKKRSTFYFDRSYVDDGTFYGTLATTFKKSTQQSIPLDSVSRIQIQDGRKNFRYVK